MIIIENTLISELLTERNFVCDLTKCKGACCVDGDAGAPLTEEEAGLLEDLFPLYKEYMTPESIDTVEKNGFFYIDSDNDILTSLFEGRQCVYVYHEDEIAKCAVEKAFNEGKINFRKPISCHLYPCRISVFKDVDAVNYHEWDVCKAARELGDKLNIPVYQFLKEALIRKYGTDWYQYLTEAIEFKNRGYSEKL
jgi:hypothetical protein